MASLRKIKKLSLGIRTTLDLTKFSVFDNMMQLTSLDIRPELLISDLWRTLKHLRIHLQTISFNVLSIGNVFLDYLSSYRGVKELLLSNTERYWAARDHTDIATHFFDVIVKNHAATLEVLEICRHSDTIWGNVQDRLGRLAKPRALKKLKIELSIDEIAAIQDSGTDDDRRLCNLLGSESRVW
ncbi:hypothetical protein P691DRAFT_703285 [Macrolepiota fuliginosa MF-IS2]|uniref:Uncharacterized protein n=1 Tax=Macrolepiota fuliginosa MF-IS2 TaxID=1400762 RepID=A0A9P6C526_9AGAR|nr:hypothetical protein P691DRAFT_703285 [Macrolepiota fuliginosa MF-IS2]